MSVNKAKLTELAQKFAAKGQYDKAIVEYQKLLKLEPNDIRTWLKMGDLYTRMGARREATDTYLRVAEYYKRAGFHLKAVAVYKQVLKLDPMLMSVYELLGEAYMTLGLTSEALIQFEQLADVAERQGNARLLLNALIRMSELDPANIGVRLRVAEQLVVEGNIKDAVDQFVYACQQLRQQGRIEDYFKVAERLLFHDPTQTTLALEVAQLYIDRGEAKRALSKLQTLFAKDPHNEQILLLLAEAFMKLGQSEKAVSVYLEMARTAESQRRPADRIRAFEAILKIDPGHAEARRGVSGTTAGSAMRAAPAAAPASRSRVALMDDDDQSVSNRSQIVTREVSGLKNIATLLEEAEVLIKYGLIERAREHFNKIFKVDYFHMEARERLKDVLLNAGDKDGACEQLFVLADGFRAEQPEGAVYYLHQVLGIDPYNRKAREVLREIGGMIPSGLPEIDEGTDISFDDSGLIPVADAVVNEVSTVEGGRLSIDEIPYLESDNQFDESDIEGDIEEAELVSPAAAMKAHPPKVEEPEEFDFGDVIADVDEEPEPEPEPAPKSAPKPREQVVPQLPRPSMVPAPPRPSVLPSPPPLPRPSMMPLPRPSLSGASPTTSTLPKPPVPSMPSMIPVPRPVSRPPISLPAEDPVSVDLSEEIEEIEFFLEQGLVDEAKGVFVDLSTRYPNDPQVIALAPRFESLQPAPAPAKASPRASTIISSSDDLNLDDTPGDVTNDSVVSEVDEVFSQFKAGVEQQIAQSDYATHYDLGQAYKEMGLFDDAIGEFKLASGDPKRSVASETMVGLCHVGAGRYPEALAVYEKTLSTRKLSSEEFLALRYEKAKVHELLGEIEKALEIYNEIINTDPGFADVIERIDSLS